MKTQSPDKSKSKSEKIQKKNNSKIQFPKVMKTQSLESGQIWNSEFRNK